MNIPNIIYVIAKILAIISLIIEIGTGVVAIFCIGRDTASVSEPLKNIFNAGVRVRNSAFCFLVLLFLIANKQMSVKGLSVLASISGISKMYAIGSLVVLILGIIVSIVIAINKVQSDIPKNLGKKIWHSGLFSAIFAFAIAYLFYIP